MQCVVHSKQYCVFLCAQGWWRDCLNRADVGDAELQQGAALRLQTAWRGFRERRLYLRQRRAALIIQTGWRRVLQARHAAGILIQAVWKSYRQRRSFLQQRRAAVTLQAACRGQRDRHRSVHLHQCFYPNRPYFVSLHAFTGNRAHDLELKKTRKCL